MKQRVVTILLAALIIAAIASYIVYRMVQVRISAGGAVHISRVVVAAHNLEIGTLLRDSDLTMGAWDGPLARGMVTDRGLVVGRGVVSAIYEGEPILDYRLALAGAGGGLAATIPAGMRACAVKVNEVVGLAGFVVPGMRVDVLVSGNPGGSNVNMTSGPEVKTVLQNIQVLSAGQNIQKDTEGKPVQVQVVNLLVTPEQAEILSLASNETKIQLVLRNPLDNEVAKVPGTAMSSIFNDRAPAPARPVVARVKPPAPPPAKPLPPQVFVIEVLNGPRKAEAKFSPDGSPQPVQAVNIPATEVNAPVNAPAKVAPRPATRAEVKP
jgi:pilus assembly protein CpaB